MTLEELLEVVNEGQNCDIADADTGELILWNTEAIDIASVCGDTLLECPVMDINCYSGTLVICIATEGGDWYE